MLTVMSDEASSNRTDRPKILLDCDPGHDDVVAIVVAAHTSDLLGITTVAGNAPLDRTTYNARVMRDLLDLDVPVHSGAERPLVGEPKFAAFVHGASGLDGAELPPPTRDLDSIDAVRFIVDTCRSVDDVWLVPVGPLTNIALAIRSAPDLTEHIAGISLMGGGTFGNRTPAAEFNVWADPEAAAIVFGCGVPLQMAGLDVTHQFLVDAARIEQIEAIEGELPAILADLFRFFTSNYISRHDGMTGAALHDPLAVLAVTHPHLFGGDHRHVAIETIGAHTRGMTMIDTRSITGRAEPNCHVHHRVDSDAAWGLVLDAVASGAARRAL